MLQIVNMYMIKILKCVFVYVKLEASRGTPNNVKSERNYAKKFDIKNVKLL